MNLIALLVTRIHVGNGEVANGRDRLSTLIFSAQKNGTGCFVPFAVYVETAGT